MKLFDDKDGGLKSRKRKALDEEKLLKDLRNETEFEKGDFAAILIAAITTILPVALVVLFLYYIISMFFFG